MNCCEQKSSKSYLLKSLLMFILFIPVAIFAQTKLNVTGIVTDADTGEELIGVSVTQKGTTIGTVTDLDGKYSISVPEGSTLDFTYLGYVSQEIGVKSSRIDVRLKENSKALQEVVVIGYGIQKKADVTTAVSSISADDWKDRPIVSAEQALQGKASGVQVIQPSGKPGAGIQVRVRGNTSLNAGNDPLYVVDGIPTNDITNLSPNDIETMSILKDASSAAIYGSRGANGVVLITTKQGARGTTKIDVSAYWGISNVSKKIKTLNTNEYYDLMEEIGVSVDRNDQNYTDWEKEVYRTGFQQNYQVSLSGGNDKVIHFTSAGYQKEDGVISPASFDRYSVRNNVKADLRSWLTLTSNMSFSNTNRMDATDNQNSSRGGVIMSVLNTPPFLTIWNPDKPGEYRPNPFQASWENPVAQADMYNNNVDYRFMGNWTLDFKLAEGLNFKPNLSIDHTSHTWDKFIDPIKTSEGRKNNGSGEHAEDTYLTWVNENIISYNKRFSKVHNFSALGGLTFQRHTHKNSYMSLMDFVQGTTYKTMTLNMANQMKDAKTEKEQYSLMSYLARVQYDYDSRYLLTANFRADGSSKLAKKWDYFPSFSAGWRFSSEQFFESLTNVVDDAKLRVAWGRNGNQNGIGFYDFLDKYKISRQEKLGEGPAISLDRFGNRDLKWEITTQYNAGMDLSLFNSRLTAAFDVYYKKTTDLLLYINIPTSLGLPSFPMRNDGTMVNKGFEFNIDGRIFTGEFSWDASLNMSFNRNKLTKLGLTPRFYDAKIDANETNVILVQEGQPLGTFYGYIADGVNPDTGDMIYRDLDGDGEITPNDRTIIGNAQPDFTFGFTHNFAWKNFSLSAFFNGSYGNDIFNATRIYTEGMFDPKNQTTTVLDRWKRPGMITDVPRAGGGAYNIKNSTRFVEDGSYIRLKSLTLSYNFDDKLIKVLGLNRLNIYGTVNNLFTLTKYRGYDPELSWTDKDATAARMGIDYGTYPQTRSFIFGLNLTF